MIFSAALSVYLPSGALAKEGSAALCGKNSFQKISLKVIFFEL